MNNPFTKTREEKLKELSQMMDFYQMEIINLNRPSANKDLEKEIKVLLERRMNTLLYRYKEIALHYD